MPDSPFDDYLDLVEAARELGIHPQSLRRLIKQKRVPAVLFAGKYLIERDKLEMFKSNYDPGPAASRSAASSSAVHSLPTQGDRGRPRSSRLCPSRAAGGWRWTWRPLAARHRRPSRGGRVGCGARGGGSGGAPMRVGWL